jgi:L-asparaginase
MSRQRVLIAYTGGTIGMRPGDRGWMPDPGYLQHLLEDNPIFSNAAMPRFEVREFVPLLDSAEMAPADWVRIAQGIARNYEDFDGFVVLHGTDTMAYTASALAFMMEGLDKPVILTGSQIPLCEPRSDGVHNLVNSLLIAAEHPIPEVCLYFHGRLHRGCRSVKVDCSGFEAFDSPNLAPLGRVGVEIDIDWSLVRPADSRSSLRIQTELDSSVGVLWLFPGITGDIVRNFLQPPLKGVVLQAFGVGNGPIRNAGFLDALSEAHDRGVVLVDCTQCLRGGVEIDAYVSAVAMAGVGAVSGYDLTAEAALTKLSYLFGKGLAADEVRRRVGEDLRGELTRPDRSRPRTPETESP